MNLTVLRRFWDRYTSFLRKYPLYAGFAIVLLFLVILLYDVKKLEYLPATIFSAMTAVFSYLAYSFSKEKFRLDLFDKRWVVYEHTLEFCSRVTQQGSLTRTGTNDDEIVAALQAANNSFRGIGWHKTRALFGEEIHELFKKLNSSYAWLISFTEPPIDPDQRAAWPQHKMQHIVFVWETVDKLPDYFKPYMYFGDYKR